MTHGIRMKTKVLDRRTLLRGMLATGAAVTIPLPNKTRLHATRAPLLPDDEILIVIRRGRTHPWTFRDLIERPLDELNVDVALRERGAALTPIDEIALGDGALL